MKKIFVLLLVLFLVSPVCVFADADIYGVPIIDQDIYEDIFGDRYICGPTTMAEVFGYWADNGFPNLIDGAFDGTVPETSGTMTDLLYDMIYNYSDWIRGFGNYPEDLAQGIRDYAVSKGYNFQVVLGGVGRASWSATTTELNAGRPIILLRRDIPHYVVVVGYRDNPREIDILYGHYPYERTWTVATLPFASLQTIFIQPQNTPPPPDPSDEYWYNDVMQWCQDNGWELEPID